MVLHHGVILVLFALIIIIPISHAFADTTIPWKITIKKESGVNGTSFLPPELHARNNETIQWINNDTTTHTVTSGVPNHPTFAGKIFDSNTISPGQTYTFTVPSSKDWSSYYYYCKIHPWMTGKIDTGIAYLEVSPDFNISTDKKSYSNGEMIRISGIVNNTFQMMPLTIQIFDSQRNLIYQDKTNLSHDYSFLYEFKASNSIFKNAGNYKIKTLYGFPSTVTDADISFSEVPLLYTYHIPHWMKHSATWWSENSTSDTEFVNEIQFLIKEKDITIPAESLTVNSNIIPTWIKDNAAKWGNDQVSDEEFISGIQYMLNHGIIHA